MKDVNGIPVAETVEARERARRDPATARRGSTLVARWTGGDRSTVELGAKKMGVQGPGELGPMQLVQAALASCLVDVVATRAALEGIELEELSVEVGGTFDVRRYLGLDDGPGPGYGGLTCTIDVRAPGADADQLARLLEACRTTSPVTDTLLRSVLVTFTLRPA